MKTKSNCTSTSTYPKDLRHLRWLLGTDVHRIAGSQDLRTILRQLLVGETYAYVFWMRVCAYLRVATRPTRFFYFPARLMLRRLRYRMGINLPHQTHVGPGLLLGHAGGVVVNARSRIGTNCNISHNVTIGSTKGALSGVPVIGDNVYIGPGAVLLGRISVGDGAAVGANAVVVSDVPAGSTVAGAPARVVSETGSRPWINRTDYSPLPQEPADEGTP